MGISDVFKNGGEALDKLFTSDDERLSKAEILMKLELLNQRTQLSYQKAELSTKDKYISWWRPTLGWACAVGFLGIMFHSLVLKAIFPDISDIDENVLKTLEWLIPILFGIRSAEKVLPYVGLKK